MKDEEYNKLCSKAKAAVDYVRAGLALIPIVPRGKVPLSENGLKNWSVAEDDIAEYFNGKTNRQANIGIVCGEPSHGLVVIDLDDHGKASGLDTLKEWEVANGKLPETVTALTGSGGKHLLYRVHSTVKPSKNEQLGVDIRGDGSYIVAPPSLHPNGNAYEWLVSLDDMDITEADSKVYAFIDYVRPNKSMHEGEIVKFELPERIEEGGRDDTLYRYGCSLRARNCSESEIKVLLEGVNQSKCSPPLKDHEINHIITSVCKRPAGYSENVKAELEEKAETFGEKFTHNRFAEWLMAKKHVCKIDGSLAVWERDHYAIGHDKVEKAMIDALKSIKSTQRQETLKYLIARAPEKVQAPDKYIAFANGVLNIKTMEITEPNPDFVICNVIPHNYNPEANSDLLNDALNTWACGDMDIKTNLLETIGICMYHGRKLDDCPVLVGDGSNGKSTYFNLLHDVIGNENVSSLDIATIGERFQSTSLIGKLANIGDDISNEFLSGGKVSVVKKAISCDWIPAEYKGGATIQFRPYATQVFSCNEVPRLGDTTYGMYRRLRPIPFNAQFDRNTKNLNLSDELATEEVQEYAILLGVLYLRNVLHQGGMTVSKQSVRILESVKRENSTILQWLHDEYQAGTQAEISLDGEIVANLYEGYANYCRESNLRQVSRNRFGIVINRDTKYESVVEWRNFASGGKSVKVLKTKGEC